MEADLRMVLEKNRIWHVLWKQSRLLLRNCIFPCSSLLLSPLKRRSRKHRSCSIHEHLKDANRESRISFSFDPLSSVFTHHPMSPLTAIYLRHHPSYPAPRSLNILSITTSPFLSPSSNRGLTMVCKKGRMSTPGPCHSQATSP
jgi:hypothetical protein